MHEVLMLTGNPSRRRKSTKRRSAAQRAATRRMLAANRATRNPSKRRARRRKSTAVVAAPVRRRSRSVARRTARRVSRRRSGGGSVSGISRNLMGMVKLGAIGGGGALACDIGMGFIAQQFPTSGFATKLNTDGSTNYMYYAAKGALAYAVGRYGSRLTKYAPAMAAGAYTVMLYEIMKSFIPAGSVPMAGMGYVNPARIVRGGVGGLSRILPARTMARILPLPVGSQTQGTVAARAMRMARVAGGRR